MSRKATSLDDVYERNTRALTELAYGRPLTDAEYAADRERLDAFNRANEGLIRYHTSRAFERSWVWIERQAYRLANWLTNDRFVY
jgi:hypothetical protein